MKQPVNLFLEDKIMCRRNQKNARRNNTEVGHQVVNSHNSGSVHTDARVNKSKTLKREFNNCYFTYFNENHTTPIEDFMDEEVKARFKASRPHRRKVKRDWNLDGEEVETQTSTQNDTSYVNEAEYEAPEGRFAKALKYAFWDSVEVLTIIGLGSLVKEVIDVY